MVAHISISNGSKPFEMAQSHYLQPPQPLLPRNFDELFLCTGRARSKVVVVVVRVVAAHAQPFVPAVPVHAQLCTHVNDVDEVPEAPEASEPRSEIYE